MDFYTILPSNSCVETQRNNNASKFTVSWDSSIHLQGKWQVALTEFKCDFPVYTLPKNLNMYIDIDDKEEIGEIIGYDLQFKNSRLDNEFKLTIGNEGIIIITSIKGKVFEINFESEEDAKKIGFNITKVLGHKNIRANFAHSKQEHENIPFKLKIYNNHFNLIRRNTSHRIYKDKTVENLNADYNPPIYFSLVDGKIRIELIPFEKRKDPFNPKYIHIQHFGIKFVNLDYAKKAGFTKPNYIVNDYIIGEKPNNLEEGEFATLVMYDPFKYISTYTAREYALTHTNLYFPSIKPLVTYLNSTQTPLKFSSKGRRIKIEVSENINYIHFPHKTRNILGYQNKFVKGCKEYIADFEPKFNKAYENMNICIDIVNSTRLGNNLIPLLKTIKVKNNIDFGHQTVFEIINPQYTDIIKSSFNEVTTVIRDEHGNIIPFTDSAITSLTLHFKQV